MERFELAPVEKRFVFGRNIYSRTISELLMFAAYVDDFYSEGTWMNKPVIKTPHLPMDSLVIVTCGSQTQTVMNRLKSNGLDCIDYFSIHKYSKLLLPQLEFMEDFGLEFEKNIAQFYRARSLLKDDSSRNIFDKLIRFKLSQDLSYLVGFIENRSNQYFDLFFLDDFEIESFVDIGSFDGSNSIEFIKKYQNYNSVHVFEPEVSNYEKCIEVLDSFRDVKLYNLALGETSGKRRFSGKGDTGRISLEGAIEVPISTLDEIQFSENAKFYMKVDVEGHEKEVIAGGINFIRTRHPLIAIAAYHKVNDVWQIPNLVLSIRNDYEVYLRNYSETIYESILYFVPKLSDAKN
jgi:FkbM family methyltransferase